MKKTLIIISFIIPTLGLSQQNLIDKAFEEYPKIIFSYPLNLNEYLINIYSFDFTLNYKRWNAMGVDSTILNELVNKIKKAETKSKWESNIKNSFQIIYTGLKVDLKSIDKFISHLSPAQKEEIKRQIISYNNDENDWRTIPIKFSKPIYSNNEEFAAIGFIFGNEKGCISIYQKEGQQWSKLGDLSNWIY